MKTLLRAVALVTSLVVSSVVFAQSPQPAAPAGKAPPPMTAPAKPAKPAESKPVEPAKPADAKAALIDINTAAKADLQALTGIGDVRADAIIKGRPYKGKDELYQKNVIPRGIYDKIKDKIIAKQK